MIVTLLVVFAVFDYQNSKQTHNIFDSVLLTLGDYSFEIYLIHLFITNMYTPMYIYDIKDATWMVAATLLTSFACAIPIRKFTNWAAKTNKSYTVFVILAILSIGVCYWGANC